MKRILTLLLIIVCSFIQAQTQRQRIATLITQNIPGEGTRQILLLMNATYANQDSTWATNANGSISNYQPYFGITEDYPMVFVDNHVSAGLIDYDFRVTALGVESQLDVGVYDCVAIGDHTLQVNTASYNTAVGSSASQMNTTGTGNTSVGQAAMNSTLDGSYNTAVGAGALYTNTAGAVNTVVGYQAMLANVSGGNNVAIGSQALYGQTTGDQNIAIGELSGYGGDGNTNSISIGYNAGMTGSNQIMLGNGEVTDFEIGGAGVITGTPTNTITPVAWMQITIGGFVYWLPLYQ